MFINYRLIPGTLIALGISYSTIAAKSLSIDKFMTDTVTDFQTLKSRPEDMKTIMKFMIMSIMNKQVHNYKCMQVIFC